MNKTTMALLATIVFLLNSQYTRAGSATWNLNPTSSDWNTAANWTPTTVPNGPADMATFGTSNITAVSIAADTTVQGVTFNSGANAFTIKVAPGFILTIGDSGVTNNSAVEQHFEAMTKANGTINVVG